MTVKRRDHILVKHRADVIRDSVSVSAVQYVFIWMVTHTACTADRLNYT